MSNPLGAFCHKLRTHLLTDAAFTSLDGLVRESWPRREHITAAHPIALVTPAPPREGRAVSIGEDEWLWPVNVIFGVNLEEDEEGMVIDVLMDLAYALIKDVRAKPSVLSTTTLPTGSHFQRSLITTLQLNPQPYSGGPIENAVLVPIDIYTCEER